MWGVGASHPNIFEITKKLVKSRPCCKRNVHSIFRDLLFSSSSWPNGQNTSPPPQRNLSRHIFAEVNQLWYVPSPRGSYFIYVLNVYTSCFLYIFISMIFIRWDVSFEAPRKSRYPNFFCTSLRSEKYLFKLEEIGYCLWLHGVINLWKSYSYSLILVS